MAETDIETIIDLARIIMAELVAASRVAPAEECLPYFDKTVKNTSDTGLVKADGTAKLSYVPFKTPSSMTNIEYMNHPGTANWTADKKASKYSILQSDSVLFQHLIVHASFIIKVYGQFGKVGERFGIDATVIQHILDKNKVFFPHNKLAGCKLKQATAAVIKEWIETTCDAFTGNVTTRFFQGDGVGDPTEAGAVPPQVLTDGSQLSSNERYLYGLSEIHGQQTSSAYKISDTNAAQQCKEAQLFDNIASVMSGRCSELTFLEEEDEKVAAVNGSVSVINVDADKDFVSPRAKRGHTPVIIPINCIHRNENDDSKLKVNATNMLVSCTSCGKSSDFSAYDAEALAAAHTNSGSGSKMGTAACAAKTAFMSTVIAMKEANNAAKVMDNQREEINLHYQQQKDFQDAQRERDTVFVEQQKPFVNVLQGLTQKSPFVKFEEDKAHLDRKLANGTVTQERYRKILEDMEK
jgi:hypothetical protein